MMTPDFRPLVALAMVGLASIPLGLWKLAELLWWVWSHLHWGAPS